MGKVNFSSKSVILVHGIWDTGRVFRRMRSFLEERGFQTYVIDLVPNDGSVGIPVLAEQLRDFVEKNLAENEQFSLIGFSLGGMVSRYYLQRLGGAERVNKFIAIASPHYGTWIAYFIRNAVGKNLRPGSVFLKDLNRDKDVIRDISKTLGTPFDLMIVPPQSARLFRSQHRYFPVLLHSLMLVDRRLWEEMLDFLEA